MKKTMFLVFVSFLVLGLFADPIEEFHTRAEMEELIFSLENQYPDICKVVEIGTSEPGSEGYGEDPIYAIKVSDNVNVDEDEPAVLFVGSVHAEELIGNEIVLHDLQEILEEYEDEFSMEHYWVDGTEIWFVPMANPSGVDIVYNIDDSFRKNAHDTDGDGVLDIVNGYGNDRDGVDLNRNWDFHWVHGDTLYQADNDLEQFDYYRGDAPNSEAETQALINLANEQHFIYSIVWHTSRTGNYSEKLFFPYKLFNIESRKCPDYEISSQLGFALGSQIPKLDNSSTYQVTPSVGRWGLSTPYFYEQWGTFQFTIETSSHRPDSNDLQTIIGNCSNAEQWLLNRVGNGLASNSPMLTGHVTDAETGEAIIAEVIVEENHSSRFRPRMTDSFGRYWRPLTTGNGESYTVHYKKRGYEMYTREDVILLSSSWTVKNAALTSALPATIQGTIQSPSNEILTLKISDGYVTETMNVTGDFSFETYAGYNIDIQLNGSSIVPVENTFVAHSGTNNIQISVAEADVLVDENMNTTLDNWNVEGPWELIEEIAVEGKAVTDSWGGRGNYEAGCDYRLTYASPINLTDKNFPFLVFDQNIYTENGFDFFDVEISTDNENWTNVYRDSGQQEEWKTRIVSLAEYSNETIYFRFRLTDQSPDSRLVDPGVNIDNIRILNGESSIVENENFVSVPKANLRSNYPNPFNPETTIAFNIENMSFKKATIHIYNLRGQIVERIPLSIEDIQRKKINWNASGNASGIYLYALSLDGKNVDTKKAILMK